MANENLFDRSRDSFKKIDEGFAQKLYKEQKALFVKNITSNQREAVKFLSNIFKTKKDNDLAYDSRAATNAFFNEMGIKKESADDFYSRLDFINNEDSKKNEKPDIEDLHKKLQQLQVVFDILAYISKNVTETNIYNSKGFLAGLEVLKKQLQDKLTSEQSVPDSFSQLLSKVQGHLSNARGDIGEIVFKRYMNTKVDTLLKSQKNNYKNITFNSSGVDRINKDESTITDMRDVIAVIEKDDSTKIEIGFTIKNYSFASSSKITMRSSTFNTIYGLLKGGGTLPIKSSSVSGVGLKGLAEAFSYMIHGVKYAMTNKATGVSDFAAPVMRKILSSLLIVEAYAQYNLAAMVQFSVVNSHISSALMTTENYHNLFFPQYSSLNSSGLANSDLKSVPPQYGQNDPFNYLQAYTSQKISVGLTVYKDIIKNMVIK